MTRGDLRARPPLGPDRVLDERLLSVGPDEEDLLLVGGMVIPATDAPPLEDGAVLVRAGRIAAVGRRNEIQAPPATRVVDTTGRWLLPGLFDCHTHICGEVSVDPYRRYATPRPGVKLLRAMRHAAALLASGFTTVRDLGVGPAVTLKEGVAEGLIRGPRILAANCKLSVTGGHGDWTIYPLDWVTSAGVRGTIVDGADAARLAVRRALREGGDLVKVIASGGGITNHPADLVAHLEFSQPELEAIVDEAHRRGVRVAAHVVGLESARAVVACGVDTIEHGVFEPDPALLDRMAEQRITLVPTLVVFQWVIDEGRAQGIFEGGVAAASVWKEKQVRLIQAARAHGVPIAAGTDDISGLRGGGNARELSLLHEAGLTPLEALQAGTRTAAEACGLGADLGTLEPGKLADILVVAANPLDDLRTLEAPANLVHIVQSRAELAHVA